jgi:hypothetical protein
VTRPAGPDGRTLVEVAGLDRGSAGVGLDQEVAELAEQVAPPTHPTSQEPS